MVALLLLVFIFIFIVPTILFSASYTAHIKMNINQNKPYGYVTFERFIKEFNKYKNDSRLEYDYNYKSIFLRYYDDKHVYHNYVYLCASIVMFEDKCMIFYPTDWLKYCQWMKKQFRNNKINGLWDND